MEKELKKEFKYFLNYQNAEMEKWLGEMHKSGWALVDKASHEYTFEKAEPEDYIYKLDYKKDKDQSEDEYMSIFKDSGWDCVGEFGGWFYFRARRDEGELPDICAGNESNLLMYKEMLTVNALLLVGTLGASVKVFFNAQKRRPVALKACMALAIFIFLNGTMATFKRYKQAKNKAS